MGRCSISATALYVLSIRKLLNASRYTGKERDSVSGLDYFGARYYASSMGRWMSPDWSKTPEGVPYADLSNPQSLNLYGYVKNNPLSRVDIDGHGELWNKFKNIFYVKASAGPGVGGEAKLTKYLAVGAKASLTVEGKVTPQGSTVTTKVEAAGGVKVGPADISVHATGEKEIVKDGALSKEPASGTITGPHIEGGGAGTSPNDISISGHEGIVGAEVGIDLDKVQDFGKAVGQSLSDLGSYIMNSVTPDPNTQNVPSPVPLSPF